MPHLSYPFLSPHDVEEPGAPIPTLSTGRWHRADDVLARLATATPLAGLRRLEEVSSVPDIWAHARTFYQLWKGDVPPGSPLQPLRAEAVAAWRGLLTLLALAESSDLEVRMRSILPQPNRPFLQAALPQCPSELLGSEPTNERDVTSQLGYLLYADEPEGPFRVAGLLTPTTLVLPGREFEPPSHPRVTWTRHDDERPAYPLIDPASSNRLKPKQFDALIVFLRYLRDKVEAASGKGAVKPGAVQPLFPLAEALRRFLRDLERVRPAPVWTYSIADRMRPGEGPALAASPLNLLNKTPAHHTDATTGEVTDCALVVRQDLGLNAPRLIFYAEALRDEPVPKGAPERVLWRDLTVDETTEALVRTDLSKADGPVARGWRILTPDDFFQPRLIEVRSESDTEDFSYHPHKALGRFLLPLTPLAMLLAPPWELVRRMALEEDEDGAVVSLAVTLSDGDRNERRCIIRRRFASNAVLRRAAEPPALALWPDFSARDWRHYLIHQQSRQSSFEVVGAVTGRAVASTLSELAGDPGEPDAPALDTSPAARAAFADLSASQRDAGVRQTVFRYDSAPEALVCRVGDQTGLLLLEMRSAPPVDQEERWRIAVDYGTTNTSLAVRRLNTDSRAVRLPLSDRTLLPFVADPANRKTHRSFLRARYDFISPETVEPPFLTLLRQRTVEMQSDSLTGGAYAIVFATDLDWLDQLRDFPGRYMFSRKWQPGATSAVEAFVDQVTLQACAEARASGVALENIVWSFTLPASLYEDIAATFQTIVRKRLEPLHSVRERRGDLVDFPLESSAALRYMTLYSTSSVGAVRVVLDVGGHSTDIAIFSLGGEGPIWEGSVEIGGRDILIDDWIDERKGERWDAARALLETYSSAMDSAMGAALRDALETLEDEERRRIVLELIVNRKGLPSAEDAESVAGAEAADLIRRLDARAHFVLFGLTEYVMRVLRMLEDCGREVKGTVGLNFCGRGSRLLQRAYLAAQSVDPESFSRFAAVARRGDASTPRTTAVSFSDPGHAKLEVAIGAAAMAAAPDFAQAKGEHPLPLGEHVVFVPRVEDDSPIQPIERGPTEWLAKDEVAGLDRFEHVMNGELEDLPEFRAFLQRYAESQAEGGPKQANGIWPGPDLPPVVINGAFQEFERSWIDARNAKKPAGFVQPMFIAAMRSALKRWDELVAPT